MLLERLRQRKVVQWLLAYCAGAWALLEVLAFVAERFAWPDFLVNSLTIVLAFGVGIALVLGWFHGERGAQRVSRVEAVLLVSLVASAGVTAYAVGRVPAAHTSPAPGGSVLAGSVAVLPFVNLSGDSAQGYFVDGFTEELLGALAEVEGLHVPARASAFYYRGRNADALTIARELRVAHLLEGSVRRSAQRLVVSVQLADSTGKVIWGHKYERSPRVDDIIAIQEEIARGIVAALKLELLPERAAHLVPAATGSEAAYDAYLRGLQAQASYQQAGFEQAIREFQRAIDLDPALARAHSALGWALTRLAPPDPGRAERSARRALELDASLAEPHLVLAMVAPDPRSRRAELDAALRLEPQNAMALYFSALNRGGAGDRSAAVAEADRLLRADPLSPNAHSMAANVYNYTGHYAKADSLAARAAQLYARGVDPLAYEYLPFWARGFARLHLREYENAASFFERACGMVGEPAAGQALREAIEAVATLAGTASPGPAERAAVSRTIAERHRVIEEDAAGHGYLLAYLYLLAGDLDAVYAVMEADLAGDRLLRWRHYAGLDPLRTQARFVELTARAEK